MKLKDVSTSGTSLEMKIRDKNIKFGDKCLKCK